MSRRNHDAKYDRFECGEGPVCEIWDAVATVAGGLLGGLFGDDGSDGGSSTSTYTAQYAPEIYGSASQWLGEPTISPYTYDLLAFGQEDIMDQWQQEVMPYISTSAQAVGGFGGSRQGVAEGLSAEALGESLAAFEAGLLSDAYNQYLMQQQAAWNALGGLGGTTETTSQTGGDSTLSNVLGGAATGYGLWDELFGGSSNGGYGY